jgi:heptosyltransferase I
MSVGSLPIALDRARRILLVKPSALGDVVHTLPVVATLHARYPQVALDWLVEEEAAPLIAGHPAVSELIVSGRRRWLRALRHPAAAPGALWAMAGFARRLHCRRYDAVLDLQGLLKSALYVAAAGAPIRVGLADAREGARLAYTHRVPVPPQPVHAVERYLALAAAVGADRAVREFTIPLAAEEKAAAALRVREMPRPLAVLHPAGRWPTKLWPVERWRALATALAGEGWGVLVTGSAGDAAVTAAITDGVGPACRSLAGLLSLKQLAAVLGSADVMVSVDSGPMHIAAAMGTPIVALFGPTDPGRTGPLGRHTILRKPLPCSPCLSRRCRIQETNLCMRALGTSEALAAAHELAGAGNRTTM